MHCLFVSLSLLIETLLQRAILIYINHFCGKCPIKIIKKTEGTLQSYSTHVRQCLFMRNSWTLGLFFLALLFPWIKIAGPLFKAIGSFSTLMRHFILTIFYQIKSAVVFFTKNTLDHYILQFCGKDLALAWLVETSILQHVKSTITWKSI